MKPVDPCVGDRVIYLLKQTRETDIMGLSQAERAFYDENGYVVVHDVVDRQTLQSLRDRITEIVAAATEAREAAAVPKGIKIMAEADMLPRGDSATATATPARRSALRKLHDLAPADDFFRVAAGTPRITEIAAELTGNAKELMLYSDQAFLKPAFEGSEKPLHQDNSYFRITPHSAGVTCWLAIDDATVENGCMQYVPGSHKLGLLPHKQLTPAHLTPDGEFKAIPVPIPAGAAIFHHLLCLHLSKANTSPNSRRAWALHYANRAGASPVKPWEEMLRIR